MLDFQCYFQVQWLVSLVKLWWSMLINWLARDTGGGGVHYVSINCAKKPTDLCNSNVLWMNVVLCYIPRPTPRVTSELASKLLSMSPLLLEVAVPRLYSTPALVEWWLLSCWLSPSLLFVLSATGELMYYIILWTHIGLRVSVAAHLAHNGWFPQPSPKIEDEGILPSFLFERIE
jgi:hypothetical protein